MHLNLDRTNGSCSPEGTSTTLGTQQLQWKARVPEIKDHMCGPRYMPKLMGRLSTLLLLDGRCWVGVPVRMGSLLTYVISIIVYSFNAGKSARAGTLKIPAKTVRSGGEKNGRNTLRWDILYVSLVCGGLNPLQVLANISGTPHFWCTSSPPPTPKNVALRVMSSSGGF
jgi:hypothetical protein